MDSLTWNSVAAFLGIPTRGHFFVVGRSVVWDGLKLLILGSVIETTRRIFMWVIDRFRLGWSISAEFAAGDISQEWITNYLIEEKIWRTPRNIFVKTKNSKRKWKLDTGAKNDQVDFIPEYGFVQYFRWKGYWLEISRLQDKPRDWRRRPRRFEPEDSEDRKHSTPICLTIFTLDRSVLYAFVEECRLRYADHTISEITVYTADNGRYPFVGRTTGWNTVKMMRRRPLNSLSLDETVIGSLLKDAREFLNEENWYIKAGIPHRRGYLLYGPPGTGKTSTIYTVAGELGLEIFALSLSSKGLDDARLSRLVSLLPTRGILVLEDIDCAFPSRHAEDEDDPRTQPSHLSMTPRITPSGLLNVLDGVGSEEGKIFFATTNHIDRLDPALIRPGRIDRKIEYRHASRQQAHDLFLRFFLEYSLPTLSDKSDKHAEANDPQDLHRMAHEFASVILLDEFSVADIQGYLLDCKTDPVEAVRGIRGWVERQMEARRESEAREQERRERVAAARTRAHWRRRRSAYDPDSQGTPGQQALPPLPTSPPHEPANGYSRSNSSRSLPDAKAEADTLRTAADRDGVDQVHTEGSDNGAVVVNGICHTPLGSESPPIVERVSS